MNKTVSINLGGQVFQIDENAFERLKKYLESLRSRFSETEGKDEIISDIEARIGEMFQQKLSEKKQVITFSDVSEVINAMGRPEDFESEVEDEETPQTSSSKKSKRLFRNPDEKIIGGVCSGLSAYLGLNDPLWLRLIFLLTFFFGVGSSLLIYVILWIIVPEAKTTSEKLEMKGENVNISNIEKTIKEDLADLKDRLTNLNTKENAGKAKNAIERFVDLIISIAVFFVKFIFKFAAVILIFVGIVLTISFLAAILLPLGIFGEFFPSFYSLIFTGSTILFMATTGLILLLGIPAIALVYLGFRILLNRKVRVKGLGLSFLGLWIVGLILTGFVAARTASDFRVKQSVQQSVPISQPAGDVLYLDVERYHTENDHEVLSFFGFDFTEDKSNILIIDNIKLDVKKSADENFELIKTSIARGNSKNTAFERAENISYEIVQHDSQVVFNDYFVISKENGIRHQEIALTLKVPEGKSVFLGSSTGNIIHDIKNVHDMYDGNMVGHTWTMLASGLTCMDCSLNEREESHSEWGETKSDFDFKDFDEIEAGGNFSIDIKRGDDFDISVSGDKDFVENIRMDKSGSRLEIGTHRKIYQLFKGGKGKVEITLPSLTKLEINGANESAISGFNEQKMNVTVSGASSAKMDLNVKELQLEINGASNVTLAGGGKNFNLQVNGASKISAFDFVVDDCDLEVTGASNAKINALHNLKANASGSSNIVYKGLPKISSDVSGFSSIKPKQ